MNTASNGLEQMDGLLARFESVYKDLHANPELSMKEVRTSSVVAYELGQSGYDVTSGVGRTGVVGVLRNGHGPVVMMRADMDALPVHEMTGLDYASAQRSIDDDGVEVPVMHACGHDMHTTCLLGASEWFSSNRSSWHGTLLVVFQPGEETAAGSLAMLEDGFWKRWPKPDVVLGQHVDQRPAGVIGYRSGAILAAGDSMRVTIFGKGGHASRPHLSIDPVVLSAAIVLRLQTIVAREVPAAESAVVTIASIHGGSKENVIPSEVELKMNVRTFSDDVRSRVIASIRRIVKAEASASGMETEPKIEWMHRFPLTWNEPKSTARTVSALRKHFGEDDVEEIGPRMSSEDFGRFGEAAGVPSVFWFVGSTDHATYETALGAGRVVEDIPSTHTPYFAPSIVPTMRAGIGALVCAGLEWFGTVSEGA